MTLVVFGSVNADMIFRVASLPGPGQTLLADVMTTEPGGKGANQAVAAALDGASVVLIGAVGQDALAVTALSGLVAAGVDLSRVARARQPTGCASICAASDGRNQIVVAPGANATARAAMAEDALFGSGTIVVTQMETDPVETAALIRRAHGLGARIIHNLAPAGPLAADALGMVDILVVNEDEASWLVRHTGIVGEDAVALHGALGITVVRTLGDSGVEWAGSGCVGRLEAAPVQAVDTTAAGDCFVGVLASALHRGDSLPAAILRANVAAGIACTRRGSQGSLPDRTEIDNAAMHQTDINRAPAKRRNEP